MRETFIQNNKGTGAARAALDQWFIDHILADTPKKEVLALACETFPYTPGTLHRYYQNNRAQINKALTEEARSAITGAVLDNFFEMVDLAEEELKASLIAAKSLEGKDRIAAASSLLSLRDRVNAAGAKVLTATRDNTLVLDSNKFDPEDIAKKLAASRE